SPQIGFFAFDPPEYGKPEDERRCGCAKQTADEERPTHGPEQRGGIHGMPNPAVRPGAHQLSAGLSRSPWPVSPAESRPGAESQYNRGDADDNTAQAERCRQTRRRAVKPVEYRDRHG